MLTFTARCGAPVHDVIGRPQAILIRACRWNASPALRVADHRLTRHYRSDLNAARISDAKSSGCSHAAKWPPFSTWWK